MELTQKQQEAIASNKRYKVYNWGRRSGKTTLFAYEAVGTALSIDGAKVTYYAQTFGDARDIAWDIFVEAFGGSIVKKNETLLEITVKNTKGGLSKVSLKGWESVVNSGKGRGTENDLVLVDEVAFCKQFSHYWEKVLDPTLLTTKGRAVFGSTPDGFNDFYDLSVKAQADESGDWFYSHCTSYDNEHNDPDWLDKKRKDITEDAFSQEYLADFRKKTGLIYKEFDRNKHIIGDKDLEDALHNRKEHICGIDFGFVHPAAVLELYYSNEKYYLASEYYESGQLTENVAEYARSLNAQKYYPDPATPEAIEQLNKKKCNVVPVNKGKDSVKNGIDIVRALLKTDRLLIHKSCVATIGEFETYAYKGNTEQPIKEGDDAMDALRYALMTHKVSINTEFMQIQQKRFRQRRNQSRSMR